MTISSQVPGQVPGQVPAGAGPERPASQVPCPPPSGGPDLQDLSGRTPPPRSPVRSPTGFCAGSTWLLTPRCRPAWIAILDLLDDDHWHPTTDVAQTMRNTSDLADQTIRKHLRSASQRGWITTRRGRTRLRNRDLIETALNATEPTEPPSDLLEASVVSSTSWTSAGAGVPA